MATFDIHSGQTMKYDWKILLSKLVTWDVDRVQGKPRLNWNRRRYRQIG